MSTTIILSGVISEGDAYRVDSCVGPPGAILIGQVDLVGSLAGKFPSKQKVNVGILDQGFVGELFIETGWGYSEYTPMDPDTLRVGPHDLIEILKKRVGETVTVIVSDQPVNLLDLDSA